MSELAQTATSDGRVRRSACLTGADCRPRGAPERVAERRRVDGGVYASPEDRLFPHHSNSNHEEGASMAIVMQSTKIAIALVTTFAVSQASAQSASSKAEEIAALKKQLRLLEERLDRLQKQTVANTSAAKAKAEPKVSVANANATIPVKIPAPPPGAIV